MRAHTRAFTQHTVCMRAIVSAVLGDRQKGDPTKRLLQDACNSLIYQYGTLSVSFSSLEIAIFGSEASFVVRVYLLSQGIVCATRARARECVTLFAVIYLFVRHISSNFSSAMANGATKFVSAPRSTPLSHRGALRRSAASPFSFVRRLSRGFECVKMA